uniref:Uncharacterized protein n=1 Tax=Arundo donax TaxID=35708 RepID=A0A0A8ZUT4_ARUDO
MLGSFRVDTVVQAMQTLLIYLISRIHGHGLTRLDFQGVVVFLTVDVGCFWIPIASHDELRT